MLHRPGLRIAFIFARRTKCILDEIYEEINGALAGGERERWTIRSREKFYSLVIHGCLRITGSLSFTPVPLSSDRERMHCDERRKDLIYRRAKFRSSRALLSAHIEILPPNILSLPLSLPFVRCLSVFPISLFLHPLFSLFLSFLCTTNFCLREQRPNESSKLLAWHPKVRRCITGCTNGVASRSHRVFPTDKLHLKTERMN